jgi:hypothetical protein
VFRTRIASSDWASRVTSTKRAAIGHTILAGGVVEVLTALETKAVKHFPVLPACSRTWLAHRRLLPLLAEQRTCAGPCPGSRVSRSTKADFSGSTWTNCRSRRPGACGKPAPCLGRTQRQAIVANPHLCSKGWVDLPTKPAHGPIGEEEVN